MYMPRVFKDNDFDDFMEDFRFPHMKGSDYKRLSNMMKTDIKEFETSYELDVEMPGFKKEDIKIELNKGYLTIKGFSNSEKEEENKGKVIRSERVFGSCERSFYIGEHIKETDIKANFKNGILILSFPKEEIKKEESKKYITIE